MFALVVILASVILALRLWNLLESTDEKTISLSNGSGPVLVHYWNNFLDKYGIPLGQLCISLLYSVYLRFTIFNVTIFLLKYVPTGVYMFKFINNIYITSRERIKQKQMELEDIQLQTQIVSTKLCVREAELRERAGQLRRETERLHRVRTRVRDVIAADEALRQALERAAVLDVEQELNMGTTHEQDREFLVDLLKGLKYDSIEENTERTEKLEGGEPAPSDSSTADNEYSPLSGMKPDGKQDCRVKIVKVTNVYKVEYLKHFIKQKRLRRDQKYALLKKKVDSVKKLFEDCQRSLNNAILNKNLMESLMESGGVASQEAMGDYSKPSLREFSDSDSELRNSNTDISHDDYQLSWAPNAYRRSYGYDYEDSPETAEFNSAEFEEDYPVPDMHYETVPTKLPALAEETISQVAIEEINAGAYQHHVATEL